MVISLLSKAGLDETEGLKLGARNSAQVSHRGGRDQSTGVLSGTGQGALPRSWNPDPIQDLLSDPLIGNSSVLAIVYELELTL